MNHDYIAIATKHGAKFEQRQDGWTASAFKRGRALPLAIFFSADQAGAARLFCQFLHLTKE